MLIDPIQGNSWKDVKSLLMDVLALDPLERDAYLHRQKVDPRVRVEVESLLALEDEASLILNNSAI